MKKWSLNLPNTLSLLRVLMVPAFVATVIAMRNMEILGMIVPAVIFIVTGLTDMLDGKIARRYGLVTDFGKFIDPLADKFMIIGSQAALLTRMLLLGEGIEAIVFVWLLLLILFRELAVTSLRLVVVGKSGVAVSANFFGKLKTVSQMVGTLVILLEPLVFPFCAENHITAYVAMGIMAFTTAASGLNYLRAYLPYMDTNR